MFENLKNSPPEELESKLNVDPNAKGKNMNYQGAGKDFKDGKKDYVDFDDPKNDKKTHFREVVNYDDLF